MEISRNQWYLMDDDDGGRRKVYVDNILTSFFEYDAESQTGDCDGTFVQLADEVDDWGAVPPTWTVPIEEFLNKSPETTMPPSGSE